MPEISRNAIVSSTAELADDVYVGPFSYIGPQVRIGPGCVIDNNVTIVGRTTLGSRTRIFPMAVVGCSAPHEDSPGECVIGEANALREHVTVFAGIESPTRIGNHNLVMIACHVGHGAVLGDHGIFDNCCQIGPYAYVEDYVRMSGFATVAPGVKVGAYSFVAGYAGVQRDAPPYAMLQGFPVRVRGVNTRNLRACGFEESDIRALKGTFRELFNGPGGDVDAEVLERLTAEDGLNPHVRRLVESVRVDASPAGEADDG